MMAMRNRNLTSVDVDGAVFTRMVYFHDPPGFGGISLHIASHGGSSLQVTQRLLSVAGVLPYYPDRNPEDGSSIRHTAIQGVHRGPMYCGDSKV